MDYETFAIMTTLEVEGYYPGHVYHHQIRAIEKAWSNADCPSRIVPAAGGGVEVQRA